MFALLPTGGPAGSAGKWLVSWASPAACCSSCWASCVGSPEARRAGNWWTRYMAAMTPINIRMRNAQLCSEDIGIGNHTPYIKWGTFRGAVVPVAGSCAEPPAPPDRRGAGGCKRPRRSPRAALPGWRARESMESNEVLRCGVVIQLSGEGPAPVLEWLDYV